MVKYGGRPLRKKFRLQSTMSLCKVATRPCVIGAVVPSNVHQEVCMPGINMLGEFGLGLLRRSLGVGAIAALGGLIPAPPANAQMTRVAEAGIEEIIVTARRREERLLDTPMSVSVFSGDLLRDLNVARIDEISHRTPGLVFDTSTNISGSNSSASVFIRGIGQTDFTLVTEPGVGIYIDDIYLTHSIGNVLDALDIERIEVLRGPQGTLFGRNTIGGAIRVVTRKPHSEDFQGDLEVIVGEYDRVDVKGHLNVPVTDNFALRFSALTQNWDGFVPRPRLGDATGDKDTGIFAVQGRYLGDGFTADLMFNQVRDRSLGAPNVLLAAGNGAGNQGASVHGVDVDSDGVPIVLGDSGNPLVNAAGVQTSIAYRLSQALGGTPADYLWNADRVPAGCRAANVEKCLVDDTDLRLDYDLDVATWGLTLEWQLGDSMSLKSISGYRSVQTNFGRDGVHSYVPVISVDSYIDVDSWSEELQLSGELTDRAQWLAGFYYFNEDGFMDDDVRFNNFSLLSGGAVETESASLFGQTTMALSERFDLTVGVRWTDETKTFTMDDRHQVLAGFGPSDPADATWWLNPANTPANTNYGFLLNFRNPGSASRVVPSDCGNVGNTVVFVCELEEDSFDYHGSLSWKFGDGRMAYFSYSTGFKGGGFQQRNANLPELPVFQAEEAEVAEIGYKANLLDRRLRVSAAYFLTDYSNLQAAVTEGAGQGVSVTRNVGDATITGLELEATMTPVENLMLTASLAALDGEYDNLSSSAIRGGVGLGNDLPRLPELQLSASIAYDFPLAGGATLTPRADWSHSDEMFNDAQNSPELKRKSYDLLDLALAYRAAENGFAMTLFWKNALDEQFVTSGFYGTPSPGAPLEYVDGSVSRPSEWGFTVAKVF